MTTILGAPFIVPIDGKDQEFPILSLAEYEGLQNYIRARLRQQVRALADEQGLSSLDRARFLNESDPRSIPFYEVERFLNDDVHARHVLRLSLKKAGLDDAPANELIAKLRLLDRSYVAKVIAGILHMTPTPAPEKANEQPAPSAQ